MGKMKHCANCGNKTNHSSKTGRCLACGYSPDPAKNPQDIEEQNF